MAQAIERHITLAEWEAQNGEADIFVLIEFMLDYGMDADEAVQYGSYPADARAQVKFMESVRKEIAV